MMHRLLCGGILLAAFFTGCDSQAELEPRPAGEVEAVEGVKGNAPSNRLPLPPIVQRNLGITFAEARYRAVAATITLPGHFELLPSAQHHYPLPAAGRVNVHVAPLDAVEAGQLLLELDAPAWRDLQRQLVDLRATRSQAEAKLARARASQMAAGELSGTDPALEVDVFSAEVAAAEAELSALADRLDQLIAQATTLTGLSAEELRIVEDGQPYWRRLHGIPIRAVDQGVVREVDSATGTWVAEGTEVIHVVRPEILRFRAKALQADLIDHLRDGLPAQIFPPEGRGAQRRGEPIAGRIRLGVTGDPTTRTVDIFIDLAATDRPPWVRTQVTALADVAVAGDPSMEELSIPQRAVIQDGLETVFFRRDPNDPDAVIRTLADLGPSNGRFVTVYSGLAEGNEVVVDGVYQLKLATTGQEVKAGHFHSDGTWHEGHQ